MRPDLAKCTTESLRAGRGYAHMYKLKFGGRVRVHPDPDHDYEDEWGGFKSSSRHRHRAYKSFTDQLGALRGNIRKSVGRKWDDVFSEFCTHLDRRSLSGYHIWTHLIHEVTLNTYIHNGEIWELSAYSGPRRVSGYYVHPVTGILEEGSAFRRGWFNRFDKPKPIRIPVPGNEGWVYEVINNLWFRTCTIERNRFGLIDTVTIKRSASKKEIAWIRQQLTKHYVGR